MNVGLTTAAVTVDGTEALTSVSGYIYVADTSTPGTSCVYTTTAPTLTNAGIVTAFGTGTACPNTGDQSWTASAATMKIDASNFISNGQTLPKSAYIIFQNTQNYVSSYELVTFTFNAAP